MVRHVLATAARWVQRVEPGLAWTPGGDVGNRSTVEVINEHLELRREGRTGEDLERNYLVDVIVLSHLGQFRGLAGCARWRSCWTSSSSAPVFTTTRCCSHEEFALVLWTAEAKDLHASHGADSFCVRDGKIVAQTIYYAVSTVPDEGGDIQDG